MWIYRAEYPNGSTRGLFIMGDKSPNKGKFHGSAATLYESGHLLTLAQYKEGYLHGSLKRWDENGTRLFYAEYKRGKRDGVVCLFRNGLPWRIEEWKSQEQKIPQSEYLVKWTPDGARLVPAGQLTGDQRDEMSRAGHDRRNCRRKWRLTRHN